MVAVRRWHWGKIVLLWAWGVVVAGVLLAQFLSTEVSQHSVLALLEFLAVVGVLVLLSVVTWIWLSGKDLQA